MFQTQPCWRRNLTEESSPHSLRCCDFLTTWKVPPLGPRLQRKSWKLSNTAAAVFLQERGRERPGKDWEGRGAIGFELHLLQRSTFLRFISLVNSNGLIARPLVLSNDTTIFLAGRKEVMLSEKVCFHLQGTTLSTCYCGYPHQGSMRSELSASWPI